MDDGTTADDRRRRLKLVLPKSFFHQAFLSPHDSSVAGFKRSNCYHFIANLVIEVTSCLPENNVMACTTDKAWEEFEGDLAGASYIIGGNDLLTVFHNMFVVVRTVDWGSLNESDSVIALADRLYSTSSMDPIIVVDPDRMPNFRASAARFYGKDEEPDKPLDIPFKMYDPMETKAHLQAVFSDETKAVVGRTLPPWNVF